MVINTTFVNKAILTLLVLTVLLSVYTALIPEVQSAGNELNDTAICEAKGCIYNATDPICHQNTTNAIECEAEWQVPLSSLFDGQGIIIFILMVVLIIGIVKGTLKKK